MAANLETVLSNEQRLIDALRREGGYLPKTDLARAAGVRELLVPEYMRALCKQGRAKVVGESGYALASWEPEAVRDETDATTVTSTAGVTAINPPTKERRRRGRPPRAESKPADAATQSPTLSIPPRQGIDGLFDEARAVAVLAQGEARIEIHPDDFVAIETWLSALRKRGK